MVPTNPVKKATGSLSKSSNFMFGKFIQNLKVFSWNMASEGARETKRCAECRNGCSGQKRTRKQKICDFEAKNRNHVQFHWFLLVFVQIQVFRQKMFHFSPELSRTFVDFRGLSRTFVDFRGLSWTFVGITFS